MGGRKGRLLTSTVTRNNRSFGWLFLLLLGICSLLALSAFWIFERPYLSIPLGAVAGFLAVLLQIVVSPDDVKAFSQRHSRRRRAWILVLMLVGVSTVL